MRRVVHISDPHFDTIRPELVEPLIAAVNGLAPDLVILSGDLTQRAREGQYRNATEMMKRLTAPVLTVPGNHDTPLYNLFVRFFDPWKMYRKWVGDEMSPIFQDDKMVVVGVNTVNRFVWRSGKISDRVRRKMCEELDKHSEDLMKIVVVHHPLAQEPKDGRVRTKGGKEAVKALCEHGADLVLSGHMHMWRVKRYREREGQYSALQIQAGTCLSSRLRGERNDFALLSFDSSTALTVERYVAHEVEGSYAPMLREEYVNGPLGWELAGGTGA